jgi:hypothetical protein
MIDGIRVQIEYLGDVFFEKELKAISGDTIFLCIDDFVHQKIQEEREACAKVCMDKWMEWMDASPDKRLDMRNDAEDCAFAIRERDAS